MVMHNSRSSTMVLGLRSVRKLHPVTTAFKHSERRIVIFHVVQINSRPDGSGQAVKALKRRLKSDNPKVLQLTLTVCETAMKNCSRPLHQALGTREFLSEVALLCNGSRGNEVRFMDEFEFN